MTTADFIPCPDCTTTDTCGFMGRCAGATCAATGHRCLTPAACRRLGCSAAGATNVHGRRDMAVDVSGGASGEHQAVLASTGDTQAHPYAALRAILEDAYAQAASGKGAERHANGRPWTEQPINTITEAVGVGFPAGQAVKKLTEAMGMLRRGEADAARREILGAIVYAAALAHHIGGKR